MQKIFFIFLLYILATVPAFAQKNTVYPVLVSFNSLCCGVPSNEPVIKLVQRFKKQYKIKKVTVDSIGPMGREGEYYLAFSLKEFSKAQKKLFIQQLKKTAATMKEQGSADVRENETIDRSALPGRATVTAIKY